MNGAQQTLQPANSQPQEEDAVTRERFCQGEPLATHAGRTTASDQPRSQYLWHCSEYDF